MEDAAVASPPRGITASAAVAAFLNHLLRANPWALERLRNFAGKRLSCQAYPFEVALVIEDNGEVIATTQAADADATIIATLPLLVRILSMREPDMGLAELSGDPVLLQELIELVHDLTWDVEEDLSQLFGDPVAHRMVGAGKKLLGWPGATLLGLAGALTEYWTEEHPLLARAEDIRRHVREVALLAAEADNLEKRIEKLERA